MRFIPIASRLLVVLGTAALAAPTCAQSLRRGLVEADVVVVGRQIGKKSHNEDLVFHRVQVIRDVRGAGGNPAVTVLDWPRLTLHVRPTPRQQRLFCLQDASAIATRLGLPAADGPYYKLVTWPGSHPLVGKDIDKDPVVAFADLLARSEAGVSAAETVPQLVATAIDGAPSVREEATRMLSERSDLRSRVSTVQWSQLMTRAAGEADDIDYKISLAELCAVQRLDGLLDALAISLGPVTDERYARCVGRVGRVLYGEEATTHLQERLRMAARTEDRRMLLLAIGATNTKSALDSLLRMDRQDAAVEAALLEHGSPKALEAVARRKD